MAPIRVEFLKSGKLVSGLDRHVARDQGYSITRKSTGIGNYGTFLNTKEILGEFLNIHRIDRETLCRAGIFAMRRMVFANSELAAKTVMMRARFVPEGGMGAGGRVFEQAEFWLADTSDWCSNPGRLLMQARDRLCADTDSIDDPPRCRLHTDPILVDRAFVEAPKEISAWVEAASDGTLAIIDRLLTTQTNNAPGHCFGQVDFGLRTFVDEASFLSAVALACDLFVCVASNHPRRAWIERLLENLTLFTGYSGSLVGLGRFCITFRRSEINFIPPDRDAVLTALEHLMLPVFPPSSSESLAPHLPLEPSWTADESFVDKARQRFSN